MRRILILIVFLIVYGSLFPWHFVYRELPANPLYLLWRARETLPMRYLISDVTVNILLYVPLGMAAYFVCRRWKIAGLRFYGPVLLGFVLSCSIEMTQLFVPTRDTSALDVVTNVIGTLAGVAAALVVERAGVRRGIRVPSLKGADRSALVLLLLWGAYLVFPLFPMLGWYTPHRKLLIFLAARPFEWPPLVSALAIWFAAGRLLEATRVHRAATLLVASLAIIPFHIFLVTRQPLPSELIGATAGVLLFLLWGRGRRHSAAVAGVFLLIIAFRNLLPFHWSPTATPFGWVPFGGFLFGDWEGGTLVLIEKSFYYGTAIWMLRAAGMRFPRATGVVAAVLLAIEIVQMHLPGRTPEITDPVLAVLEGYCFAILARESTLRQVR